MVAAVPEALNLQQVGTIQVIARNDGFGQRTGTSKSSSVSCDAVQGSARLSTAVAEASAA